MTILQLSLFAAAWIIAVYLANSLLSRRFKKINLKHALLYAATIAMLGVGGEIFVGSVYSFLFNQPLWNYTVFPVHGAYTSKYALVLWAIYGFQIYLLHEYLTEKKITKTLHLALIFCLEAIILEALVNITFLAAFGKFVYYYFPSDLWHLTSVQTLPFYFIAGFVITCTLKRFKKDPIFFTLMSTSFAVLLVFLA